MRRAVALGALLSVTSVLLIAGPAGAGLTSVPAQPHIVDPAGDANYVYFVDQPTPDSRPEADILAAWFSADRKIFTANWLLSASPVGKGLSTAIYATPLPDAPPIPEGSRAVRKDQCVYFRAFFPGGTDPWEPTAFAGSNCALNPRHFPAEPEVTMLENGSFLVSLSFRRSERFFLRRNEVLTAPWAASSELIFPPAPIGGFVTAVRIDTTPYGEDFRIP